MNNGYHFLLDNKAAHSILLLEISFISIKYNVKTYFYITVYYIYIVCVKTPVGPPKAPSRSLFNIFFKVCLLF